MSQQLAVCEFVAEQQLLLHNSLWMTSELQHWLVYPQGMRSAVQVLQRQTGCKPSCCRPSPLQHTAARVYALACCCLGTTCSTQTVPLPPQTLQQQADEPCSSNTRDPASFKWLQHWYPVHVLAMLDPSRPHAVEVLGKQLVLWRDGEGHWRCMEDACPHRCGLQVCTQLSVAASYDARMHPRCTSELC